MAQHAVAGTLLLLVPWSVLPASAEVYTSNGLMQTHRITVHGNGAAGNAAPLRAIEVCTALSGRWRSWRGKRQR